MKLKLVVSLFVFLAWTTANSQSAEGLQKINGTNLFVREIGKGEPLIIIHGGPGLNHSYFLPHLDALSKSFKLVYYDQRACGQSAIPSVDSLSLTYFTDDIEGMRKSLGVEKVNILAHSWGALLAVNYGLKYPQHVKKLVLSNPVALSLEYQTESMKMLASNTTKQDSIDRASVISSESFKTRQVSSIDTLMKIVFRASFYDRSNAKGLNLNLPLNYFIATNSLYQGLGDDLQSYNYYDAIKVFTFPLLVIAGKADNIPVEALERIAQNVPKSKLVVFEQSGHFPFIEERTTFTKKVSSFLKK